MNPRKVLLAAPFLVLGPLLLIYFVTKIQFPTLDEVEIVLYLVERLGVGQIQGAYEQFSLRLHDFSYIINEIPFSGMIFNRESFSKDLMMLTGGYGMYLQDIGVMNSFFIGEALAIGGEGLIYISPFLVAFNYCLIAYIAIFFFARIFRVGISNSKKCTSLLIPTLAVFTGDFGGLLVFKKLIAIVGFLMVVFFVYRMALQFFGGRSVRDGVARG
ncbi:hypothetical protein VHAB30_40310 [Variovorax boronicumulans]|nr:hypothetical protein VHAB30_40310 [Variovorax boronicumulans]